MRRGIINLIWWIVTCGALLAIEVIGYRCIRLNLLTEYNNTLYHSRAVVFVLSSDGPTVDISGIKSLESFEKCILLKYEYDEYEKNGLVFWGSDALDISGAQPGEPAGPGFAIVGAESVYPVGSVVEYREKEYPVEYCLTEHINPLVNIGIFVYEDIQENLPTDSAYVLTSSDKRVIADAYDDLEKLCLSEGIRIRCLEIPFTRYEDYIRFRELYNYLLGLFALFMVFVCVIHRLIWVRTRKRLNNILQMLGSEKIVSADLMSYGCLIFFSCLGSALIYLELYGRINIGRGFLLAIIAAFAFVFLGLTVLIPCIKKEGRR